MAQMVDVQAGDVLAGKYRVDRVLGAGAMGVVVQAYHLALEKKVAIKFLLPDMASNEEAVARFAREARAIARIANEHVTHVLDVGTLETGAPFMVMEFLDGTDLHKWLRSRGALTVDEAVDAVAQVCEAIAEAHDMGIVHRDLKPANLFCVRRGDGRPFIKVLDFGISKMTSTGGSGSSMSMTRTASMMGTPLYMAPEQMASSRDVDPRADIWSLGVILFELLSGRVPFEGETLPEVCLKVTSERAPSIRSFRPDVPESLAAAIDKCLEKDRNARYSTVAEFHAAIATFGPVRSTVYAGRTSVPPLETIASPDPLERSSRSRPPGESLAALGHTKVATLRRPASLLTLGGLGAAALIGLVIFATTRSPATEKPAVSAGVGSPAGVSTVALVAPVVQPPAAALTAELALPPEPIAQPRSVVPLMPPTASVRPIAEPLEQRPAHHAATAHPAAPVNTVRPPEEVDHGF